MPKKITNNFKKLYQEEESRFAARQHAKPGKTRGGPCGENEIFPTNDNILPREANASGENKICCALLARNLDFFE